MKDSSKPPLDEKTKKRLAKDQEIMRKKWDKALEGVDRSDLNAVFDAMMKAILPPKEGSR